MVSYVVVESTGVCEVGVVVVDGGDVAGVDQNSNHKEVYGYMAKMTFATEVSGK